MSERRNRPNFPQAAQTVDSRVKDLGSPSYLFKELKRASLQSEGRQENRSLPGRDTQADRDQEKGQGSR